MAVKKIKEEKKNPMVEATKFAQYTPTTPVAKPKERVMPTLEEKFAKDVNRRTAGPTMTGKMSERARKSGSRGPVMSRVSRGVRGLVRRRFI